jgi:outer membrane receptor protein involved in Fe transport
MMKLRSVGSRSDFRARTLRSTTLVALSALWVAGSSTAFAQAQTDTNPPTAPVAGGNTPPAAADDQAAATAEIVVSGTRIVRNGYSQPTPVTVVGTDQLQTSATSNIADYVNTLPVFLGSATPITSGHSSSGATAGLNTLNLRNLGASRTLVLIDGQRSVGSTTTGLVDVNTIPQDLVERVDVVTGGASAVYGSDALSGAVNFVLNKNFKGTKAEVSGGVTDYGDDRQWKVSVTEGFGFADDRGHFIVSAQASGDQGIKGVPRAWNQTGQYYMVNPGYAVGNGQPQYIRVSQATLYNATPGGVIANTALAQTAFGPGGTPYTFHLGSLTSSPFTSGGDWASNPTNNYEDLVPREYDQRVFTRASYQITDHINVFGQFSWARSHTTNVNEPIFYLGSLPIKSDNAFIPASVASQLTALGITQFNLGTLNGDLPKWTNDSRRTTSRYVLGANGDFSAVGTTWTWNTYFQRGETKIRFQALNVPIVSQYMAAVDAVRDPKTGAIICRSTLTNPTNGCVPYNVFGTGVNTQASINYFEPTTPTQHLAVKEDVVSGDVSGEPFSDWAGPVSLAIGFQHRRESADATADANTGKYFAANYARIVGSYTVTEGSLETVVPIARDQVWAHALDLNAAVRFTDYSTSGFVVTWKVGATWDIVPGLRIRATRSRDIRAPNLSELFQAGAGGTGPLTDRFFGGAAVTYRIVQQGNLDLEPEKADNTGVGVVLQPHFLPGFSASVDYWNVSIKKAIGTINSQQIFDLCFQGNASLCSLISPDPSKLTAVPPGYTIINEPINLASQKASGIDLEASYRMNLADFVPGVGGTLNLRYLGTRYINNRTDNRLTPATNIVGAGLPKWRHNITALYNNNRFTGSLTARITSAGAIDNSFIVCQTGCPASSLFNPTVSNARMPGSFYLDTALSYDIGESGKSRYEVFVNVRNLLNKNPPIVPAPYTSIVPYFSPQTNLALYDVLGRTYRVGVRVKL